MRAAPRLIPLALLTALVLLAPAVAQQQTGIGTTRNLGLSYTVLPGGSIQSALSAAAANGGGTVHVQAGTYTPGAALTISANTTLECEPGATLSYDKSTHTPISWFGMNEYAGIINANYAATAITDSNIKIKGCTFTVANAPSGGFQNIFMRMASFVEVSGNNFTGGGSGTAMLSSKTTFVHHNTMTGAITDCWDHWEGDTDIHVTDNYCSSAGYGMLITGTQTASSFTASISGTTLTVTANTGGPLTTNTVIAGAGVTAATQITAYGTGAGGIGTYTVNNSQTVASEAMTGTSAQIALGGMVARNTFVMAGASPQAGIYLNGNGTAGGGAADIVISSNVVDFNGLAVAQGILIGGSGSTGDVISGNIIRNGGANSGSAVKIGADTTNTRASSALVSGNTIDGIQVSAGNTAAIALNGNNSVASGNRIIGGSYTSCVWMNQTDDAAMFNKCDTGTGARYTTAGSVRPVVIDTDASGNTNFATGPLQIAGGALTGTANALMTGGGANVAPNFVALTGLVKGNGASAPTAVTAPTGTVVGTSDAQTLTAKTLTDPINQEAHILTTSWSNSGTTLSSMVGLAQSLTAAGLYTCSGHVHFTTAPTSSNGVKVALATSDTLTVTTLEFNVVGLNGAAFMTTGTGSATALAATAIASTNAVTDLILNAEINVNAAGTLQVQMAENAASGTIAATAGNAGWRCHRAA